MNGTLARWHHWPLLAVMMIAIIAAGCRPRKTGSADAGTTTASPAVPTSAAEDDSANEAYQKAFALHLKGCTANKKADCTDLGIDYQKGRGTVADLSKAATAYQTGCDTGQPEGCCNLGFLYDGGHGVPQDLPKASGLFRKACDGGDRACCASVGTSYLEGRGVTADRAKAAAYFKLGCDADVADACVKLGELGQHR